MSLIEFTGLRSRLYKEVMAEMPDSREEERLLCLEVLAPKPFEHIVEAGAGGGFFSASIARAIYPGTLVVTDPSPDQLDGVPRLGNIQIVSAGAERLPVGSEPLTSGTFDAVWSAGSFHHVPNKSAAFSRFFELLKPGGRLVIADVFAGSALARHFDLEVAKHCITGHEVSFLSQELADSLAYLAGFEVPSFHERTIHWKFRSMRELGNFLYKIHAMTKSSPDECAERAAEILGVEYRDGMYCLAWPLTVLFARKG